MTVAGVSDDASVVVRRNNTADGKYFTVNNPTLASQSAVVIDFGAGAMSVEDRIAGTICPARKLQFDLHQGEVRAFH